MWIYTLRVKRSEVGPIVPFDRVYLVKHQDRACIEELFRAALVMPFDESLRALFRKVTLDLVVMHGYTRDDDARTGRPPEDGELESLLQGGWIMVVPIRPRWKRRSSLTGRSPGRGAGLEVPRYLTSPKWYAGKRGELRSASQLLPTLAYLQMPGRKVRPICVACPRMVAHQAGECHVGNQAECCEQLSLGLKDTFEDRLSLGKATTETEEEDGLVRSNHAHRNRAQETEDRGGSSGS